MEQLMLPVRMENRFTICPRCREQIYLADVTTPEEDVAAVRRHICIKKWKLQLVGTRA